MYKRQLSVLRVQDIERLQLNMDEARDRAELLRETRLAWQDKLAALYGEDDFDEQADPEQQLYAGFIGDRDRRLCEQVRQSSPAELARGNWIFADERLPELLFRYRARNFAESLQPEEQARWHAFCQERLSNAGLGAPNTVQAFEQALEAELAQADAAGRGVLQAWQEYVARARATYSL